MENPLQNKLLLYYMSGLGGGLGGEGSAAQAIGGITQQQIQTENFQKLLRTLMLGGAKATMDKEGLSLKAPYGAFADTDFSIPGFKESYSRLGGDTPEATTYNPSASPLDVAGADLAGLTPEMISQALQLKFAGEELERKKLADIAEAGYYGAAARKMEAETVALTPSIDVPGLGKFTNEEFVKIWTAATKDQRSAAVELYEYYADQERSQGRTPKSIEDWTLQVAEASGKSLAEIMAEFMAKKEAGTALDLAGPDFPSDVKKDLMKDRSTWGYPSGYDRWLEKGYGADEALDLSQKAAVLREMDSRIRSFYKGESVERRKNGWYVDGKLKVRNPYGR